MPIASADPVITVLIVDDTRERASALQECVVRAGGVRVACTLESPLELPDRIAEHKPDVVLIHVDSPSRDVLEQLAVVSSTAPRPVVMFTEDAHEESIRSALKAGVSAYIVDGLAAARLEPIMKVAMERFEGDRRLRDELASTKVELADRKVIERAKGLLMKSRAMGEDEAFAALRSHAMDRGIKLADAARQVIEIAKLLG